MADISDVNFGDIKDLYQRLESLSCKELPYAPSLSTPLLTVTIARIMTRVLY